MRRYLVVAAMTAAFAQQIPGLGTDPLGKGAPPPVVKQRVDPPARETAKAAHERTLDELAALIAEATALRAELAAQGPERVSKESVRRLDKLRKSLKAIEADLKRR